nr:MAG TPA: hypothetical protein [Caudoviricetes sp.]
MSSVGFRVFSYYLCGTAKVQLFSELQKQNNKWQNSSIKNSTLSSSK